MINDIRITKGSRKEIRNPMIVILLLIIIIFEVPLVFLIAPICLVVFMCFSNLSKNLPINLNVQVFYLSIFIITYFGFDNYLPQSGSFKVLYCASVIGMYFYGLNTHLLTGSKKDDSEYLRKVILLIAGCFYIYVLVTIINGVISGRFLISRNPFNIWTGTLRAATHYGTMLVFPVAVSCCGLLLGKRKLTKIVSLLVLLGAVLTCLLTASRTILYMIPIGLIVTVVFSSRFKILKMKKNVLQSIGMFMIGIVTFSILIGLFSIFDLFDIKSKLMETQLGMRIINGDTSKIDDDPRLQYSLYYITHFSKYIWGGGHFRDEIGNAHNLWLNTYDIGGIVPFIFLLIYTFSILNTLRKLFYKKGIEQYLKVLVVVVYILCLIQMMLEPILESVPVFFWAFVLLNALVFKLVNQKEIEN